MCIYNKHTHMDMKWLFIGDTYAPVVERYAQNIDRSH